MLTVALTAHAQPAPAASGAAPNERVQRDADKVFRMILQHADKPRRASREEVQPAPPAQRAPAVRAIAAPSADAVPPRAIAPRVTASTPPPVVAEPALPADARAATSASGSDGPTLPADVAATSVARAAIPVTVLASEALAMPRSTKLELVSSVEPEFPLRLVRQLGWGSVVVNFDVRPDGTVARTEVAKTSHRGLNDAAQAAVAAWRFKPISETVPGVVELKFE